MIKKTTLLSESDWHNLHGNDIYVKMLRNKVQCDLGKNTDENYDVFDYVKEVPEGFVYYKSENIYGHITVDIYFETALDMENFISFFKTSKGISKIKNS